MLRRLHQRRPQRPSQNGETADELDDAPFAPVHGVHFRARAAPKVIVELDCARVARGRLGGRFVLGAPLSSTGVYPNHNRADCEKRN